MTRAGELHALAERCETAEKAIRALDVVIHTAVTTFEPRVGGVGWPDGALVVPAFPGWQLLPAYTASLDAALTLVPGGFHLFTLGEARYMTRSPAFCAQLEIWTSHDGIDGWLDRSIGVANTLALALCAAALKACAASGTLTEGGDVEQAPGDSLSGPTAESRDAQ